MFWVLLVIVLVVCIILVKSRSKRKREEQLIWECDHMSDREAATSRLHSNSQYRNSLKSWKVRWKMYQRLANKGDHFAECRLGRLYAHENKFEEAFKWFERAANGGEPEGMYWLSNAYYEEEGVAIDYRQAKYWAERGLSAGNSDCALLVRLCNSQH